MYISALYIEHKNHSFQSYILYTILVVISVCFLNRPLFFRFAYFSVHIVLITVSLLGTVFFVF